MRSFEGCSVLRIERRDGDLVRLSFGVIMRGLGDDVGLEHILIFVIELCSGCS